MVTVTELRDMHPEALSNGAQAWRTYVNKLDGYAQDLAKYYRGFEQWHGEAADAADKHVSKLRTQLDETITVTGKIAPVLETACDNIEVARNELRRVIHEAEASGFAVADDGSVYPNMPYQMAMIYLQGYIDEYERRIGQALTKANQADASQRRRCGSSNPSSPMSSRQQPPQPRSSHPHCPLRAPHHRRSTNGGTR